MDKMVLTMYLTTTFVAASEGVIVGALFQPGSSNEEEVATLGAADAVFCMIASQIAKVDNYGDIVSKCSLFTFMFLCTALIHWLVFYPAGFFDLTGKNAYKWYANVPKALMMAFATDGSVAALPNTIAENVQNNGVREDVARFVLPLGATLNMDGSAIYYSMAYILYANYTGQSDALTMGAYITIAIVSSFLSIGAAPVPSAGLVYLVAIIKATGLEMKDAVSLLLAIDWMMDRIQIVINVSGDSLASGIVTDMVVEQERKAWEDKMHELVPVEVSPEARPTVDAVYPLLPGAELSTDEQYLQDAIDEIDEISPV
eukprot:218913_1